MESSEERRKGKLLLEMTIKYSKSVDLIVNGKRSEEEIVILNQALQIFIEGRLAGAMTKVICEAEEKCSVIATDDSDDFLSRLQKVFSVRVEESTLPVDIRYQMGKMGIMYVGELLMIIGNPGRKIDKEILREFFISSLGAEVTEDSAQVMLKHWVPPYWQDRQIEEKFNLPLVEALKMQPRLYFLRFIYNLIQENFPVFFKKEDLKGGWYNGWPENINPGIEKFIKLATLGEFLSFSRKLKKSRHGRLSKTKLAEIQDMLNPHLCLHAGMFLPPYWTPPEREEPLC